MFSHAEIIERSERSSESFWDEISKKSEYFFADRNHQASKHFVSSILQGATVKARSSLFFEAQSGLTNDWTESKFKAKEKLYRQLILIQYVVSNEDFVKLTDAIVTGDDSVEKLTESFLSLRLIESDESQSALATTIVEIKSLAESGASPAEIVDVWRHKQFLNIVSEIKSQELEIYHSKIKNEALAIQQMSLQDRKKMEEKKRERQAREAELRKEFLSDPVWQKVLFVLIPALSLTYCGIKHTEDFEPWNHPGCEALGMETNLKGTHCYFKD
jgi:hypothetical protein